MVEYAIYGFDLKNDTSDVINVKNYLDNIVDKQYWFCCVDSNLELYKSNDLHDLVNKFVEIHQLPDTDDEELNEYVDDIINALRNDVFLLPYYDQEYEIFSC